MLSMENKAVTSPAIENKKLVRTLLFIVAIKLFLMFAVLKVFFFPDFLKERFDTDEQKSEYIGISLTERQLPNNDSN